MNHKIKKLQKLLNSIALPAYTGTNGNTKGLIKLQESVLKAIQNNIDTSKSRTNWNDQEIETLNSIEGTIEMFRMGSNQLADRISKANDE